ncbi:MAG TPA: MgtC/SapB family protein [Chitinophagaceae bacterium]|nr:MgtC/SapB family protein [Chitinophagaceae bacterium]
MPFHYQDLIKLLLSLIIGGCIGWEREYHGKSAGLRTMIVICMGSTLFTIFSLSLGAAGHTPDRIASNIITGMVFLGAGIIFREENKVSGMTTAATIWVTAALGMGVGGGFYLFSFLGAAVVLAALLSLVPLQRIIDRSNQSRTYRIVCIYQQQTMDFYENLFRDHHMQVYRDPIPRPGIPLPEAGWSRERCAIIKRSF